MAFASLRYYALIYYILSFCFLKTRLQFNPADTDMTIAAYLMFVIFIPYSVFIRCKKAAG